MRKFFFAAMTIFSLAMLSAGTGTAVSFLVGMPEATAAVSTVLFAGSVIMKLGFTETGIALTALDISALNTALGAYFRKGKDQLISEMLLGMNIDDRFEVMDDVKDELVLPNLSITDLVKPANDTTFAGTANALAFNARILKVRRWKVDLLIVPGALEKSWLGKYKKKGSDAYDLPFEQYIMNYIISKVHENVRMKALYAGVYNAAGTAPVDIMNGLLKLIADEITATTITPVVTGAITSANVIDKVELVYDALGEAYKAMPTIMPVNPTIFDWYVRKYRATYGTTNTYSGVAQNSVMIDGSNCTLLREPGLGTSQRLICTPKENMVYGVDSMGEENNIKSQEFERTIKLMIDAKSGVQFKEIHARALAVGDQA